MRISTRTSFKTSTIVAAGKLCVLALAALAPVAGQPDLSGPSRAAAFVPGNAAGSQPCRHAAWPYLTCGRDVGEPEPARRVRVIAIGASAGPLAR